MFKTKYFKVTVLIGFILGLLPTIIFLARFGFYPKIPLEIMDDTLYYFGRIREVMAGNLFIGNSYLLEHVKDVTTAFFVADWVYSIPFLFFKILGSSFSFSIIFSEVLWSVITTVFLYSFYKIINIEEKYIPIAVTFSLLTVLYFIFRPVAMSVVYPVFIFFLISYLIWLRNPMGKKESVLLVASSVLSFYLYTYLWQIVLVVLGATCLFNLYYKKYIKQTFFIIFYVFILSIPVFLYTIKQINSIYYFETLRRVGLVSTHMIGSVEIFYIFLILNILLILYLFRKKNIINFNDLVFFVIVSVALLIVGLSNLISGKDLELAVHVGRFIDLFISVFVVYSFLIKNKNNNALKGVVFFPILILFLYSGYNVFITYSITKSTLLIDSKEYYVDLFTNLKEIPKSSVILSDDLVSSYIPVLTDDYVLFHPNAELYNLSDYEVEERYLVSRVFADLNEDQLKSDFRKYAGVGNAVHQANIINREVKMCLIVKKIIISIKCGEFVDSYSLIGEKYFEDLMERYKVIKSNPDKYLDLYHVSYIIKDNTNASWIIKDYKILWSNDRFTVYSVETK